MPIVDQIYYPKYTAQSDYLEFCSDLEHPGYGGLFSIVLKTSKEAEHFYDLIPINKGPSLGTSFTLACPYTVLAHYCELDWAQRYGVSPWLVRVSVGVEDLDWLIKVFLEALDMA